LAHPSSGIVVDQQGQVYFQDIVGGAIWKIDAQGKLTKFQDGLGGHWMARETFRAPTRRSSGGSRHPAPARRCSSRTGAPPSP
jgi:hypothetical protein